MPGPTRNTGYLQNIVQYDASNNITLPANLTVTGVITGYATTSYVGTQLGGYVPTTRTISINGTSLDLSANRSFTINSMVYPGAGIAVSTGSAWGTSLTDNSSNWNTAYGWGNHAGLYSLLNHTHTFASLTSKPTTLVGYGITDAATSAQGTSADTAYGWGNHAIAGYLTGITSGQVTTALGFTPYNATNPSGYITTAALSTYATESYVGTQIANLVASSPAALDTLNELAAALGNDAAFSTTVSTALGNRLRVDINTQGLSATLQGYGRTNLGLGTAATSNTGDFAAASHTHSIANVTGLQTALDGKQASGSYAAATHSHIISDVTGLQTALDGKQASLGFTPYNSTNPSGYITSSGSISGNAATATSAGYLTGGDTAAYMLLYNALSGDLNTYNSPGLYSAEYSGTTNRPVAGSGHFIQISDAGGTDVKTQWYSLSDGAGIYMRVMWGNTSWRAWRTLITDANIGSQSVSYATTAGSLTSMNISQFTNNSGYITSDATKLPLAGGTMTGQLTIDGLNFSGNTDSLYITNKRGAYYPLRILNSQGDYRGVLIEHVDGTGSGGPGPDGSFGFKFEDKRGSNYSGDHKASFIVKRSGAFAVTSIFEVISTSNTSLAVTTGGKVVVNSTSNIATGALSIVSGGSAGVGWGSGLNIGDSANYMSFIQDVGTSRFRNHGNGVFEFFNSGGDTNFAISSLGNLSIRGNALGGGFVNLLSASKQNYYTFTGYPNQNTGGVPKNVCDEVNSAGLSWTSYGYQTSADGAGLAYIKVDLNAAHLVTHFAVFGYIGGSHKPTGNWNLLGSNDDVNWTTVGTANAAQWMADDNGTYPFRPHAIVKCSNPGSYRYYRVQAYGWTNNYLLIHNWGLFTGGAMTDIYNDGVTTGGAVYAGGDVTAYSDISVKENIRPIINSLEKITKSRGVLYDRIDSGAKNNIGFIAQELEINFPELIHTNDDGTKGVKYQNATAILFEAIKEQQTQIESQKSEIDELKDLVQQLINR